MQVTISLKEVIEELAKESIFVFCVVADNAAAFQKAARLFEGAEGTEISDDEEVAEPDESEGLPDVSQAWSTEGIFCVRCAAHSLQLVWISHFQFIGLGAPLPLQVLRDFEKNIPIVASAVELVREILEAHAATPEKVAKFVAAQVALGKEPKQLVRVGETRCIPPFSSGF